MFKEAVVLLAIQALLVSSDSVCPDRDVCENEHTCCQGPTGEYSCCPHHQGECCDDHLFCCPEHTICLMEEEHPRCVNDTISLPRTARIASRQSSLLKSLRVISASPEIKDAVVCPDKSFCPAEFSCVKLPITFGCCPITQGIVCADGKHCCPEGLECSSDGKSCVQPQEPVVAVICGDGKSECPQGTSCSQSSDGLWGCCPFPRAVYCDDDEHCCPKDSTCDVKNSKCISSTNQHMPMWAKFPARLRADWEDHDAVTPETSSQPEAAMAREVPCDDKVACEDGNTCCKTTAGDWACCPLPKAVCCDDHIHCCPEGTTCDTAGGSCLSATGAVSMLTKLPAVALPPKENDVTCDSTASCPDGTTCCKNEQGQWACCPLPEAVCCDDHIHCCPEGTTCDTAEGSCLSATGAVSMLTKLPALALPPKENDVTCDSTASCPDGTTCCKNEQGQWACCPLPEAVCCDDHIHCCPKGTTCDTAGGSCLSATGAVSMLTKLPALALPPKENDVTCDSTASCPDGTTCCKNEQGQWACCPLPEAVCCDDHIHCCPKGTTCDTAGGSCLSATGAVSMLTKLPALALPPKENDVTCDSTASCPDGTTCCKNEQGQWACCPLPEAVCCDDHIHCCPKGTTCDTAGGSCLSATGAVSMLTKLPATTVPSEVKEAPLGVKCDSTTSCPDHTTCCFMKKENKWGCCPFPNALCCEDGEHCCPAGYKCNTDTTTCTRGDTVIPWYNKLPAQGPATPSEAITTVTCDSDSSCPSGSSCCQLSNGKWGCCPLIEAVCCSDQAHCCPRGYTCNLEAGSCQKSVLFQAQMLPLIRLVEQEPETPDTLHEDDLGIHCDDQVSCPIQETCCMAEGGWGCCPAQKATCCADKKHCCPAGYTCGEGGTCIQATRFYKDNWQVFFSKKKRALVY
ncbi:granulin a isoform X1 [Alosa sapidissima]|uniref:granulin a isoform X1 n=1 Tax=Alosa sapidissima TaxID=34773 RepID=UPI001C084078|nr:granulin a isoform X1 [Alosa sapidissima]XP_041943511.1 granulin a isoform X1 [Alosa sapidissima]